MAVSSRIRTILRLFFLFAVLVMIAVVSAITTIRLTIHGQQETLPNLVGQPLDKAQITADRMRLHLEIEDKLFDTKYPANSIVSQMPPAGTPIKPRQYVHVLLSLGPPQTSVPDVVGGSVRAARITAVERGLTIGDVAALYWPTGDANNVVAQDPPSATTDLQSPAVNFLVSLGPTPAAYLCPDFVGKSIDPVRAQLQQAGFQDVRISRIPVPGIAQNTIVKQLPLAGNRVTPDTTFEFQVAQ